MRSAERRKVNVFEMKCLTNLLGAPRIDRASNEDVSRRTGLEKELARKVDQRVLQWFGHVERMDAYHMARRVLMADTG